MKVSVNSVRSFNDRYHTAGDPAPNGTVDLVEKIGRQLGGVEEVISFGTRFAGIPVVKVVSCVDHPNSDHLHICKADDGGVVSDVPRDADGFVQIVTGAPNVREGFVGAWLPPGSTVPESLGKDPFVLEARPLRGEISYGMLASARELTLGDDHNGLMELDADITPGTWLVDAYQLRDDQIIDIENKMFTHRPDCFGWIGIGREMSAIYHQPYKSPEWYVQTPAFPDIETDVLPLVVKNEIPELVPRFTAIAMRNITVKPSPVWLQIELSKYGLRSINNIVDYTNFFMLETGQPLHAYDYDKVLAQDPGADHASLIVRHPIKGEKLALLNGKTVEPNENAIFIATEKRPIGLAGVMGGGDTEVSGETKNIILECGTFDMYTIRRMSMAYGVFTDAVSRFNKGQSPLQNLAVLAKIVDEIRRYADGLVASQVFDVNSLPEEAMERGNIFAPVNVTRSFIADRLGLDSTAEEMAALLRNAECTVDVENENLTVTAPFWRMDIAIPEDVVEEVGRLYGYDKLPLTLPKRDLTPAARNATYDLKKRIADQLCAAGANEVLTYSFVHSRLLNQVGQKPELAYQIGSALSPDLQYYRLSLTPSLLDKVHSNSKAGHEVFALFELNKVHLKGALDGEGLPLEFQRLALVLTADGKMAKQYQGAPFFQAKVYLRGLFRTFGVEQSVSYKPLAEASFSDGQTIEQMCRPYEPGHSAVVVMGSQIIGVVGEYRASVRKALKLPSVCAGFELITDVIASGSERSYVPLPRFPKIGQDICLKVSTTVSYQRLYDYVLAQVAAIQPENVHMTISPVDIYQREGDAAHKQITLRLSIASYERTLTDVEVNKILDAVAVAAKNELQADRV